MASEPTASESGHGQGPSQCDHKVPETAVPKAYRRRSWRRPLTVLVVIAVLLAVGAYVAYNAYQRFIVQVLTVPGCQAGTGQNAIPLDFGQAADAATVAGVAVRDRLPRGP